MIEKVAMGKSGWMNKILRWRPFRIFKIMLMRLVLPGFDGIPLYNVLIFFGRSLAKGALTQRAAAISFNFFLALFPAILFFFTLIPYIPIENFQATLMMLIEDTVPSSTYQTIETTLTEIIILPHDGLMSLGFFMALFFATNGFKSIMTAFETSYYGDEQRAFIKTQFVAIFLLVITVLVTTITIGLITFNRVFLDFLIEYSFFKDDKFYYYLIYSINVLLQLAMIFFVVSFIYYYAPINRKQYRFISVGSTFATVLYIFSFIAFDQYITHFSTYNVLYGSIGTLIIILMWIYLNSIVLLIGFELNASIKTVRKSDLFSIFRHKKELKDMNKKLKKEGKLGN
ncbi:MAG: YihY/virulence factor BrkB family protein [Bacteroidetes bacterium]|nr:MAG: YihY/virulence factor BrkB family protein [Bacteroidota bacterium]